MSKPDIFLEMNSTRFVGPLDVTTTDKPGTTRISTDPSDPSVTLSDGDLSLTQQGSDAVAQLSSGGSTVNSDGGALWLMEGEPNDAVEIAFDDRQGEGQFELSEWAGGAVKVYSADSSSRESGGVIRLTNVDSTNALDMKAETVSGESAAGRVRVRGSEARGVVLRGNDAVAELTGKHSATGARDGGDLLIRRWPTQSEVSGSPKPNDIHVHATADATSDYGRGSGNPPRILLDGPSATVDLGRKRIDSFREGETGRFKLRYGMGGPPNTMLEGGITTPSGSSSDRYPELIFRRNDQGTLETTGAVRAESRGLVFYDAGTGSNQNAALVVKKDGTVATRYPIAKEVLSKVGPQLKGGGDFRVSQGNTAEISFKAGDGSTIDWKIGDESDPAQGYEIRGTMDRQGGTDLRMTLTFDTSAAGSSTTTVTLNGDWTLSVNYETTLSNQLSTGDYEINFNDQYGSSIGALTVQ